MYLAISPFYLLFAVFGAFPIGYGVYLSFQRWDGLGEPQWVGLNNYEALFADPVFWKVVGNTLIIYVFATIPMLTAALIAAFVVSMVGSRMGATFTGAAFLPNVTSVVAAAIVFQSLFNPSGLLNVLARTLGLPEIAWMTDGLWMKIAVALMIMWQGFGYFVLLYLAGLGTISPSVYEAARLDGARAPTILFRITLPMLRPVVIFTVLTCSLSTFQVFAQPQVLFGDTGGPGQEGMTLMLYQFVYGFRPGAIGNIPDYGFASAVGWVIFVLLIALSALNWAGLRRFGER